MKHESDLTNHGFSEEDIVRLRASSAKTGTEIDTLLNDLAALHGKDLVCFCAPCQCHGHTLEKAAEWASQTLNLFEG